MLRSKTYLLPSLLGSLLLLLTSCWLYKFNDVTIDPKIKTVRVGIFENRARYQNTRLAPSLTDRFRQKVANQTRLIVTNGDSADLEISGTIVDYSASTSGISNSPTGRQQSINRLTVTIQVKVNDVVNGNARDVNVTRNFDYDANLTLQAAENRLLDEIVRNVSDEIFNQIFSRW